MSKALDRLVEVVATLRAPNGCPWDKEQTHNSILSDMLEEMYEFFEAVDLKDKTHMREELGDILLQIVFHSQIASEENHFTIDDVANEIADKLIRRHPHVFGNMTVDSTDTVIKNWDAIKSAEKGKEDRMSILDGIPKALPSLFRAEKVQQKAAKTGFDWPEISPVLDKVEEEFKEFREALESGNKDEAQMELGDILFSLVNVARHQKISAEESLRVSVDKFIKRFNYIETQYEYDHSKMKAASLDELDTHWNKSKKEEL